MQYTHSAVNINAAVSMQHPQIDSSKLAYTVVAHYYAPLCISPPPIKSEFPTQDHFASNTHPPTPLLLERVGLHTFDCLPQCLPLACSLLSVCYSCISSTYEI